MAVAAALLPGATRAGEERLPAALPAGGGEVRAALAAAPAPVELDGTPLSGCLVKSSEPAEIQDVGAAYLAAAAGLGQAAAREPEGEAALQLGYLVGAVRRGSDAYAGHPQRAGAPARAGGRTPCRAVGRLPRGRRAGRRSG